MENEIMNPQAEQAAVSEPVAEVSGEELAEEKLNAMLYTEEKEEVPEEVEEAVALPKIYLVRRQYTAKDGRRFWEYVLPVLFNGNRMEVRFVANDRSGYEGLDNLFANGVKKVEMQFSEEKQVNDVTKEVRKYYKYEAIYTDQGGFMWRFPLKLKSSSDKAYMENYIRYLKYLVAQAKK